MDYVALVAHVVYETTFVEVQERPNSAKQAKAYPKEVMSSNSEMRSDVRAGLGYHQEAHDRVKERILTKFNSYVEGSELQQRPAISVQHEEISQDSWEVEQKQAADRK